MAGKGQSCADGLEPLGLQIKNLLLVDTLTRLHKAMTNGRVLLIPHNILPRDWPFLEGILGPWRFGPYRKIFYAPACPAPAEELTYRLSNGPFVGGCPRFC